VSDGFDSGRSILKKSQERFAELRLCGEGAERRGIRD
jgi:sulfur relay (sulfurtransferase) complex TusBCD TusD component (DsrE family)